MLRVVHVLDCYRGGVRRHVDLLASAMPEFTHELAILGRMPASHGPGFARVHQVPFARRRPWSWRRAARRLAGIAQGAVVHAHSTFGGWVASLAARGGPIVYTPHAHFAMIPVRGPKAVAQRALVQWERAILPRRAAILSCGPSEDRLLRGLYPDRNVVFAPHGWDLQPPAEGERDIDYLFVGRLDWQKNPQAFVRMAAREPQRRFVMVGEGPLDGACRSLARRLGAGNLEMAGFVASPREYMQRARHLVLTSRYEGFPYVALEAMDAGCRILVRGDGPGLADILDPSIPTLAASLAPIRATYEAMRAEVGR